jgi:hypothetical protein
MKIKINKIYFLIKKKKRELLTSRIIFILNLLISSLLFSMEFILEIITSPEIKGSSPGCWQRRDWPLTYT